MKKFSTAVTGKYKSRARLESQVKLRLENGMSDSKVARETGVSRATVWRIRKAITQHKKPTEEKQELSSTANLLRKKWL